MEKVYYFYFSELTTRNNENMLFLQWLDDEACFSIPKKTKQN